MPDSRRGLLKKTLVGAVLLAAAGAVPVALRKTKQRAAPGGLRFLTPAEYSILAAVAERILTDAEPRLDVAQRADAFLAGLPQAEAKDFKRLLALFDNALYSLVRGGPPRPFTQKSPADQDAQLAGWQASRIAIERSGYQALKRLVAATYFSDPRTYASLGYPGPPVELVKSVAR